MKKALSLLILFFTVTCLTAQDTWTTLLPETTDDAWVIEDMVKTNDGGFAILGNFLSPIYLYKYNGEGELLWEKTYLFGEDNHMFPRDMVELSNGNLAIIGQINVPAWYQFVFITNSEGDSLSLQLYTEYDYFKDLTSDGNQLYFKCWPINSGIDSVLFVKSDANGMIIDQNKLPNFGKTYIIPNEQKMITLKSQTDSIVFYRFNINGDLELIKKQYNDLDMNGSALIEQTNGGNLGFYQEEGMLILDDNFNLLYTLPVDNDYLDIFETNWPLLPEHVLGTSDDGFLLTGYAWNANLPFEQSMVYMIKLSAFGEVEWKRVYNGNYSLALNNARHVVEVNDGYVFVGVDLEYGQIWLVKFNEQGWFTGTDELKEKNKINVYPNPCYDHLLLTLPDSVQDGELLIFNTQGQMVLKTEAQGTSPLRVEVASLNDGMYYFEMRDTNSVNTYTGRFIKH